MLMDWVVFKLRYGISLLIKNSVVIIFVSVYCLDRCNGWIFVLFGWLYWIIR